MERTLPIWELQADILRVLSQGNRLVLIAPTGSGKTTQVPQILCDAGVAGGRRIVILQPRRVAARTVAARVAWERDGKLGGEVGYQIRFDDQLGDATRICFVTEGILLRWLQDDGDLSGIGAVLFDEFHERNLLSDVALALVKQLQESRRPDLKMVVMSATLDAEPIADYLRQNAAAPILISEGIAHPVETHWLDYADRRPVTEQAADTVERIVNSGQPGDLLVFMPGMGEINATINALQAARLDESCAFIPLHGDLPAEQQDLAFAPQHRRKIVVATNVAETSVTIDGIRHVVDSGVARVARYDAERGVQTLLIEDISRASADQRKGRAGRTAPGTCWRLWTESSQLNRPERNTPEIQRSDLAEVVLLLHSLGIKEAAKFDWLDRPELAAVQRAERLLVMLGALQEEPGGHGAPGESRPSSLTAIGRQMLRLPMHPRYSRMLVEARRLGCVPSAALCAALTSGRDLLMRVNRDDPRMAEAREVFEASQDSDFYTLMRAYQFARRQQFAVDACRRAGIHAQTARQVGQTYDQIMAIAEREGFFAEPEDAPAAAESALLKCLCAGFIDQLAIRRDQGTLECDLLEQRSGTLMRESVAQNATLLVVAEIREVAGAVRPLTLLGRATVIQREWLEELFPQHVAVTVEHLFDRTHKRVAAVKLVRFTDLVIGHEHQRDTDPAASGRCLADAAMKGWFELPNLNHEVKQFIARVNLVAAALPDLEYPPFDAVAMTGSLAHGFAGLTLQKEAIAAPLKEAFASRLAPEQLGWLDELTPTQVPWPTGKPVKLTYAEEVDGRSATAISPEAQVKLSDCFKLEFHPFVCEGAVPVKLWLCTPDGKRLASTCDWLHWRQHEWPKQRSVVQKKFPSVTWA